MELLCLENLTKIYPVGPGIAALQSVSLQIEQGQYVAIMGHSGSGKSTMLNTLGALDRPTRGQYHLQEEDVSRMSDAQLSEVRNLRIGFVFQSFNLIPGLSILENIEIPLFYRGMPRRMRHPRSVEMAEMVGLGERMDHRPAELSGGQQQRVAVARALVNDPLILVADEPTGNLDTHTATGIMELFDDLHARGRTIIMVTHEDHVAAHAHRIVTLRDGRIESDSEAGRAGGSSA